MIVKISNHKARMVQTNKKTKKKVSFKKLCSSFKYLFKTVYFSNFTISLFRWIMILNFLFETVRVYSMSTFLLVSGDVQRSLALFAGYATLNVKISPEDFVSIRSNTCWKKQTYSLTCFYAEWDSGTRTRRTLNLRSP